MNLAKGKALMALGRKNEAKAQIEKTLKMAQENVPNPNTIIEKSQQILADWK